MLACASALLIQGCTLGDRAEPASGPVRLTVSVQPVLAAQPRPAPFSHRADSMPVAEAESAAQPMQQGEVTMTGSVRECQRVMEGPGLLDCRCRNLAQERMAAALRR